MKLIVIILHLLKHNSSILLWEHQECFNADNDEPGWFLRTEKTLIQSRSIKLSPICGGHYEWFFLQKGT